MQLKFSRYLNSTTWVVVAIVLLVVVWIGSGMIGRDPIAPAERPAPRLPTVAVSWSEASEVVRELVLYGDVEPAEVATIRARVDGIVEAVPQTGAQVNQGDTLVQLSRDDREARLSRAQAQLASAQRDYDAAIQLQQRGITPQSEVQVQRAQLEAARAELRSIELEIANTALVAPITGIVNRIAANRGAYVSVGGEVLQIVDNDPLITVVQVQQNNINRVRQGMAAVVRFIGGDERSGVIRFVAPIADAATRTFRVEVEVDNPDRALPSGLSAEVIIATQSVLAHRISTALVRLDAQGRIGLYVVDENDRVEFVPVEVVRAQADGIWVSGLPDAARLVTISQGALAPGQQVQVSADSEHAQESL